MVRREPLRIIKERRKEKRSGQVLDGNNGGNREKEECVFSHLPSLTDGCPRSRPSFGGQVEVDSGVGSCVSGDERQSRGGGQKGQTPVWCSGSEGIGQESPSGSRWRGGGGTLGVGVSS